HEPQGFSVAVRMGHAEITLYVIFRITTALMADDCDRRTFIGGDAPDNRRIIAVHPASEKFDEVIDYGIDLFMCRRTVYLSRNLHTLPRCKIIVYFILLVRYFLFKKTDFLRQIQLVFRRILFQFPYFLFKFLYGFLQFERHDYTPLCILSIFPR